MDDLLQAVKAAVAPTPRAQTPQIAFKATGFIDDDGVIIARVSVADVRDAEKERATEAALKAATWELAMKSRPVAVDLNHDKAAIIDCDIVGVFYDYADKATVVHLRPHDRAIYEAAKSGEIVGMSWSGPYLLSEDDQ